MSGRNRRTTIGGAREMTRLLDTAFTVPGTRFRFGIDPILGLVPGLGDLVGGSFAAYLLWVGVRVGAPAPVLVRMFLNIGVDALFGAIPLVGDLLDAGWKANVRNLDLLEDYLEHPAATKRRSYLLLAVLLVLIVLSLAASVWLAYAVLRALFEALG